MKKLKMFLAASVLMAALSLSALAGDIDHPVAVVGDIDHPVAVVGDIDHPLAVFAVSLISFIL